MSECLINGCLTGKRLDEARAEVARLRAHMERHGLHREAGCQCHLEVGDSPCVVHAYLNEDYKGEATNE